MFALMMASLRRRCFLDSLPRMHILIRVTTMCPSPKMTQYACAHVSIHVSYIMHMTSYKLAGLKHVCIDCGKFTTLMLPGLTSTNAQSHQGHNHVSLSKSDAVCLRRCEYTCMHMTSYKLAGLKRFCIDCGKLTALMPPGLTSTNAQSQQGHNHVSLFKNNAVCLRRCDCMHAH